MKRIVLREPEPKMIKVDVLHLTHGIACGLAFVAGLNEDGQACILTYVGRDGYNLSNLAQCTRWHSSTFETYERAIEAFLKVGNELYLFDSLKEFGEWLAGR